jgi:signal transduction histidine kinase
LIEETVRLFQPQFRHRGIDLETRLEGTTPLVWLDPDRFKQALMNLLVNARDALPDGGQVLVTCGHDRIGEQVVILVEDNGPGIAPDQQAGALAGGDSDKPQGLGLGLRLSRELVQAHGGTLGLGCSRLGGLRAEIRLPSGTEAA